MLTCAPCSRGVPPQPFWARSQHLHTSIHSMSHPCKHGVLLLEPCCLVTLAVTPALSLTPASLELTLLLRAGKFGRGHLGNCDWRAADAWQHCDARRATPVPPGGRPDCAGVHAPRPRRPPHPWRGLPVSPQPCITMLSARSLQEGRVRGLVIHCADRMHLGCSNMPLPGLSTSVLALKLPL